MRTDKLESQVFELGLSYPKSSPDPGHNSNNRYVPTTNPNAKKNQ